MSCHPLVENGKVVGWACSIGRQETTPCYICGRSATRLCDGELENGTCNRALCSKHCHHTAKDTDYCEECYRELMGRQMTL